MKTAKKWMRRALFVGLALPCLGVFGLSLYMQGVGDLRTEYVKQESTSAAAQKRGRTLLEQSSAEIGGLERWRELKEMPVEITFVHDWHDGFLRRFFMPIEFSGQKLLLALRPGELDARLTFLDGDWEGTSWGISEGRTYRADADGAVAWEPDETVDFNLKSYRFFFFLPFLLAEAELISYAGERTLRGKTYDLVFATWGSWEPQRNVDQYLLWICRDSSRIDFVQSTVREKFPRSIVTLALDDYRVVQGVKLAFSMKLVQDMEVVDAGMHHVKVVGIERADGISEPPRQQ